MKAHRNLIAVSRVAAISAEHPVRCREPSRSRQSHNTCSPRAKSQRRVVTILSRSVSVVDSFVEVKGELKVDGTGDFEVGEIQNLSEVVDVEASHSSSDLDDDDVVGEDADAGDVDGDDVDRRSR